MTIVRPRVHTGGGTGRLVLAPGSLVGLAFAVRMIAVHVNGSGGLGGVFGYDAGVYYAASDSLLQGLLPYRDFVLLHPPGLPLVLTPFAALGRLTSDHTGYVVANLAFVMLSAVNAGLVFGVARRLGAGPVAAWLGGAFYAMWFGAVLAEVSLRLEPLAAFAALLGAFVLARPGRGGRAGFAGGALLGFSACVKLWWALPVIVLLAVLIKADRRIVRAYLAGTTAAVAVVIVPFFAAAPGAMWRMIVLDQVGRDAGGQLGTLQRPETLASVRSAGLSGPVATVTVVIAVALIGVLLVLATRTPAGRVVAAMFVLQAATLLLSPAYFAFYGGFLAPAAGLLVALSAVGSYGRFAGLPAAVVVAGVAALSVASIVSTHRLSAPFPRAALGGAVADARCVGTDSPVALIELNVLTRNLRNGCPNWVDVSGRSYGTDASKRGIPRRRNPEWQADLLRYLRGNDVVLVVRTGTEPSPRTRAVIRSWPVLRESDGLFVRAVPR